MSDEFLKHLQAPTLEERNKAAIVELMQLVNYMSNAETLVAQLVDRLQREHRTIQQQFISVLMQTIVRYGEEQGGMFTDARNQEAKKWAAAVRKLTEEMYGSVVIRFPLI